jgi:hypothetical protein
MKKTKKFLVIKFDQAIIEFGVIANSGSSASAADNSIVITFSAELIDNGQANGTVIYTSAGAQYFNNTEIWIGQASFAYTSGSLF